MKLSVLEFVLLRLNTVGKRKKTGKNTPSETAGTPKPDVPAAEQPAEETPAENGETKEEEEAELPQPTTVSGHSFHIFCG